MFESFWEKWNNLKEKKANSSFACRGMYRYFCNAGFKVETYQSNLLHSYCFDTTNQSMLKLIKEENIPFSSVSPFDKDIKEETLQAQIFGISCSLNI